MNQVIAARLYFLFALVLCVLGWKISQAAKQELAKVQAAQKVALERVLSEN
jgi:hypothetical protein